MFIFINYICRLTLIFLLIIIDWIYISGNSKHLQWRGGPHSPHHQCVAPTWVTDGSQSAPERSPHTSVRWRVWELINQPIIQWEDLGARLNEPGWAVSARTPPTTKSPLGSFMSSVRQDLSFTSPPKDGTFHSTPFTALGHQDWCFGQRKDCHLLATTISVFPVGLPSKY